MPLQPMLWFQYMLTTGFCEFCCSVLMFFNQNYVIIVSIDKNILSPNQRIFVKLSNLQNPRKLTDE